MSVKPSTVLLLLSQSTVLAFMAAGIGLQLFELSDRATRIAGLQELHYVAQNSAPVFLAVSIAAWVFSEVKLFRMVASGKALPNSPSAKWLPVFVPIIFLMYAGVAFLVFGGAGLLAAGVVHLVFSEQVSLCIGATVAFGLIGWLIYAAKT